MTGYEVVGFKGLKALGIDRSRTQIDRDEKDGKFPKSFKLSASVCRGGRRVWWLREVIEWLKSRAAR
jgi:predicted DNA-binding transcriptional regulator AlpA